MSSVVLARKWRPKQLSELYGQDPLKTLLSNSLRHNRIHHAYLFSGLRGVGKTTIARILAKCLNCEKGVSDTPCMQCAPCLAIDAGNFMDVMEIDAASRTKVEETRELLDNIAVSAQMGRYKIYVIDEVHMLSTHSFNALLKTLEEPPAHVIFILATTDPQKLPATVVSRCLHLPLNAILPEVIAARLAYILEAEKIAFDLPALEVIAKAGEGSLRDALSLTERAIALSPEKITLHTVSQMLGIAPKNKIIDLVQALSVGNSAAVFAISNELLGVGQSAVSILKALSEYVFEVTLAQISGVASDLDPEWIQNAYQLFLLGIKEMPYAPSQRIGLEMTFVRILGFCVSDAKKIATHKTISAPVAAPIVQSASVQKTAPIAVAAEPVEVVQSASVSAGVGTSTLAPWNQTIEKLNLSGLTKVLAKHCVYKTETTDTVYLILPALQKACFNAIREKALKEAICLYLGRNVQVKIEISEEAIVTPIMEEQKNREEKTQQAKTQLEEHAIVKQLQQEFNATIAEIHVEG